VARGRQPVETRQNFRGLLRAERHGNPVGR